ncbi:LysR family transcriptional regulator [Paludibacterium purpuratum]|uniref:LysR family transcriptional regulator n=1 Tax=Paludibacterium purpuratum TaxID=1144873 RepID=A0A4R7B9Q5_9NEIS|nr:LysR family transcriptional regulator [Paludibacterium purpuratum]TDR80555.1 LysR family transcriptional regulator [Paludibacterium purpuratum]
MNLAELRVFRAVHECGGVSQAAQRLHCVQSNVTARLKQLEMRLGVQLFIRKNRRMEITARGRVLLAYAERLIGLADEAEQVMTGGAGQQGLLRLGSMETTAAVRLPAILSGFHQQYPKIAMQLTTGPTRETVERVREYDLDIGFVSGPVGALDLQEHLLWQEKLVLITERNHPPVKRASQLVNRSILAFRNGCAYRQRVENWFSAEGVTPDALLEFGSTQAILGCVSAGMGVAVLPQSILDQQSNQFSVATHALPSWCATAVTAMIWRPSNIDIQAVRLFIEHVTTQFLSEPALAIDFQSLRRPA